MSEVAASKQSYQTQLSSNLYAQRKKKKEREEEGEGKEEGEGEGERGHDV